MVNSSGISRLKMATVNYETARINKSLIKNMYQYTGLKQAIVKYK